MTACLDFNFIELAHLQRAGIDVELMLTEFPAEILRKLYSDIIPPQLSFQTKGEPDRWYADQYLTYLDEVKQNPIPKQLMTSLSFMYLSAEQRGWDVAGPVNEELRQLADPLGSHSEPWSHRSIQNMDAFTLQATTSGWDWLVLVPCI